jgi:hypothetical protein
MFRDNRLIDVSPRCNIDRCDVISRTSVSARLTSELVSCWPVGLRYMPTIRTSSRGVAGINQYQRHTSNLGFVLDEGSETIEVPSMQVATLSLANRCPGSNAIEIFKCNRSPGVFGFSNQLLGNAMIYILRKSGHPARKLLKMALGRLGPCALKSGLKRIKPISGFVDMISRMDFTIGIYCKVLDAKIDSKNSNRVEGRLFWSFDNNADIEPPFYEDHVGLTSDPVHPGHLIISNSYRNLLATFQCQNGNRFESIVPGHDPLIIDNCTIKPKLWFNRFVSLIGFNNLRDGSDGHLGRETIPFSDVIIDNLLKIDFVRHLEIKSCFGDIVARFVEAVHCFQEHTMLIYGRVESDHQSLKHYIERNVQCISSYLLIRTEFLHQMNWRAYRSMRL